MTHSITPLISIQQVTKRYPGVVALQDVNLDIRAGRIAFDLR